MTFDPRMLYYECISEFKRQFYKDLLTLEHVQGGQIKIDKVSLPDGSADDEYNFWGYQLEKDGKKYLLSALDQNNEEIDLRKVMPIRAKSLLKVASKGVVYYHIKNPVSMKFKAEKTMTFKEFIGLFTSLVHSNPEHQKLLWFMALTQMFDRANFRITTPAGFGKDSTIGILGNLIGKCVTIEHPTLAKLEYMTNYKWLGVNEVVDIGKTEWKIIEQFLLTAGDLKPEITKHSRAIASGVGETLDISNFSISLFYNDIDHYIEDDKYFDSVTKVAVKDRFPAFRLYGNYSEPFNQVKDLNLRSFVQEHYADYIELIHNYAYYKQNFMTLLHNYKTEGLISMPERWKINVGRLLKIIDIYCDTQEEFTKWVQVVNSSMNDYKAMLIYPNVVAKLFKQMGIPSSVLENTSPKNILYYLEKDKDKYNYYKGVLDTNTFMQKNYLISIYSKQKVYKEVDANKFWSG